MPKGKTAQKKPRQTKPPALGGALLADSVSQSESGKFDLQGVFTLFWAWGFPCSRSWFLTLTAFGLPKGKMSIVVSLRKVGSRSQSSLAVVDAEAVEENTATTISVKLGHTFESPGRYEVLCAFKESTRYLSVPFEIRAKRWPEYSEMEKEFARKNDQVPKYLRANVHCKQCSYAYIFEESILGEKPKGGVHRFPENGEFECRDCGHVMNLRDIQGRLRASLKEMVQAARRRK